MWLKLKQWKIFDSEICRVCNQVDNIFHHFVDCEEMAIFWNSLGIWWSGICNKCEPITIVNILLGIVEKRCHRLQMNFIILYAKWFIYKQKYLGESCFFLKFLPDLKTRLLVEQNILVQACKYDVFVKLWYDILHAL